MTGFQFSLSPTSPCPSGLGGPPGIFKSPRLVLSSSTLCSAPDLFWSRECKKSSPSSSSSSSLNNFINHHHTPHHSISNNPKMALKCPMISSNNNLIPLPGEKIILSVGLLSISLSPTTASQATTNQPLISPSSPIHSINDPGSKKKENLPLITGSVLLRAHCCLKISHVPN